jgi:predicted nucleic acid-binding protein
VVDASVAVKWLIDEEHTALAGALSNRQMSAPSLLRIECANALLRRARAGDIPAPAVPAKVRALRLVPVRLVPSERYLEGAIALATELRHSIYDCLYLALALDKRAPLVTADGRFVEAVRRHRALSGAVALLTETAH